MNRITLILALGAGVGLGTSCVRTSQSLDPSHCNSNDGDRFCAEAYADGSRPFCRLGTSTCMEAGGITDVAHDGCFAERPEDECYSACGEGRSILDEPDYPGCGGVADSTASSGVTDPTMGTALGTGTSGETATDTTDATMTGETSGTTEGPGCTENGDCPDAAAPFCDGDGVCVACDGMPDPNVACAEEDALRPVCDAGSCVQCTSADAAACDGQTPVCNAAENTCTACTEHTGCPDTACHLDGVDVGACFDEGDVVMASNTTQLEGAFAGAGANGDLVIVLTGTDYSGVSIDFTTNAEVAVIGDGSQDISGNRPAGLLALGGSSLVYFAGVSIQSNGSGNGLDCSGTSVWLDDSEVRNNSQVGLDVSGGCAAHLRRTIVRVNNGGGVVVVGGASELWVVNSAISGNGNGVGRGIQLTDGMLEMTYSTIVRNDGASEDTLLCSGGASGVVANSILSGRDAPSVGCPGVEFFKNVSDDNLGANNQLLDVADETVWFADFFGGDYRLNGAGTTALADLAEWREGDPLTDFEGDPIPTDMQSFPGYDQP